MFFLLNYREVKQVKEHRLSILAMLPEDKYDRQTAEQMEQAVRAFVHVNYKVPHDKIQVNFRTREKRR